MNEIEETFENIVRSYKDYVIALRLAYPAIYIHPKQKNAIDKTNFANATNVIGDALLHRAALAITRIYDKPGKDRMGFEKLFDLMKQNVSLPVIRKKYDEVKNSQHFQNLKDIRDGRLAHLLKKPSPDAIDDSLHDVYHRTQAIIEMIEKVLCIKNPIDTKFYTIWHKTGKQFWNCVFTEGDKYAMVAPDPATSAG